MLLQMHEAILAVAQPFALVSSDGQTQRKLVFKPLGLCRYSTDQKLRKLQERLRQSGVSPGIVDTVFQTLSNDPVLGQAYKVLPCFMLRFHVFVPRPASLSPVHDPTKSGEEECRRQLFGICRQTSSQSFLAAQNRSGLWAKTRQPKPLDRE
jgi:hypothetical protein